jgi:hypothetical protein
LGKTSFAGSVADAWGKEKARGGVLAQHESVVSRVDTSSNRRGHDSAGSDKRWMVVPELGCTASQVSRVGLGDKGVGLVVAGLVVTP